MWRVGWIVFLLGNSIVLPACASAPNVLFIAVDDLNDWIGCLGGHPQALTPNIDRLAARGVLFTNAHCAAPACNPSRAAIFSGRHPHVTGVWSNQSGSVEQLYPEGPFLPVAFADSGYATWGSGKLLHSGGTGLFERYRSVQQRWSPLRKDDVRYTADELPSKGSDHPEHMTHDSLGRPVKLPRNRMPSDRKPNRPDGESFDWGPFDVPDADFGDTKITDWAIEQMGQQHEKPWFLGVGYYRPHIPLWAPARYFARFQNDAAELPPIVANDLDDLPVAGRRHAVEPVTAGRHATVVRYRQWGAAVEAYLACISYIDAEIGRLLDALEHSVANGNTVIVLWSDHGWHLGEKEHWGKWTGWERSTRVPLVIVPAATSANRWVSGAHCRQPVSLIDIYPTLLELCGIEPTGKLDGQSLVPLLENPDQTTDRIVVTMFDRGNISARDLRWRYIRYADRSEELYDHRIDPHEWHNHASIAAHAEVKARFVAACDQMGVAE